MLATTAPLSQAMVIAANTSRAKTSIPIESTTWLEPLLVLNFHKRGYMACKAGLNGPKITKNHIIVMLAIVCLIASELSSKLIWKKLPTEDVLEH